MPSLVVARWLALVATAVPIIAGSKLFWSAYSAPRHRELVGPAGPDFSGVGEMLGGCIAIVWAVPLAVMTVGIWMRRRWALIAFATLSALQAVVHIILLFSFNVTTVHYTYATIALVTAISTGIAAARLRAS